jgi:hypothetical protein
MAKIPLISLNKQTDIGNSINSINNNFSVLQENIDSQQEDQQDIQDFVDSIPQFFSDLKHSFDFFKKNYNTYKETMEVLINNKEKYLKPIITIYPQKFRYDNTKINAKYIENVIHDWVTSNYKISNNKLTQKPYYVEGQSIIIYFLRSSERIEKSTTVKTTDYTVCVTGTQSVSLDCVQNTVGKVCNGKCGCFDCGGPLKYTTTEKIKNCFYNDNGVISNGVVRSITSNISYNYTNYIENNFEFVKFVVEDCTWKVDNSPSSSISPYKDTYKDTPIQFIGNTDHLISDSGTLELYTFN